VLLITDGEIWQADEMIAAARKQRASRLCHRRGFGAS
jgi:hypothetical protein